MFHISLFVSREPPTQAETKERIEKERENKEKRINPKKVFIFG